MGTLRFEVQAAVPLATTFDRLVDHFRGLGYRLEEADRMNFRVVMDRGNVLGSIFGGSITFRRLWLRATFAKEEEQTRVTVTFTGRGKAVNAAAREALRREVQAYQETLDHIAAEESPPAREEPPVVREVVIKEVVRVPCQFCGSLVENTARKCPDCGAPLR